MNDTSPALNIDSNTTEPCKMYSVRAIGLAVLIGGPLAAGFLARTNFINQGQEQSARNALFIGVISTILLFVGLFTVPEHVMENIPNMLIPLIYTGIVYFLIEKFQGPALAQHKESGMPFYSIWRAIGIGFVCLLVMMSAIFAYGLYASDGI